MPGVTVSSRIEAPVERVFAAYTDLENAPSVISAIKRIEILTPGPVGVGTRFRETRVMMGKEATEEMTFAVFEPGARYVLTAESHGSKYTTTFRFTPEGNATRVTCDFLGEPQTAGAKILTALMLPLMKGMIRKCLVQDIDDVRRSVEAG